MAEPEPLNYATAELPKRTGHTRFGIAASVSAPMFLLAYCAGLLGKEGGIFLILSPIACFAAIIEGIARKRRIVFPAMALTACVMLFGVFVYLLMQD